MGRVGSPVGAMCLQGTPAAQPQALAPFPSPIHSTPLSSFTRAVFGRRCARASWSGSAWARPLRGARSWAQPSQTCRWVVPLPLKQCASVQYMWCDIVSICAVLSTGGVASPLPGRRWWAPPSHTCRCAAVCESVPLFVPLAPSLNVCTLELLLLVLLGIVGPTFSDWVLLFVPIRHCLYVCIECWLLLRLVL